MIIALMRAAGPIIPRLFPFQALFTNQPQPHTQIAVVWKRDQFRFLAVFSSNFIWPVIVSTKIQCTLIKELHT